MDQKALVTEKIEAAKRLIERFDARIPLSVAFWLKPVEKGRWYLYLAFEPEKDESVLQGYKVVGEVVRELNDPETNLIIVKAIPADSRLARAALDANRRYPTVRVLEFDGDMLGDVSAEAAYFYPLAVGAPAK